MATHTELVLLSLGSNQQPEIHLTGCAERLRQLGSVRFSPVYRCPAEGFEGEDFLNAAAAFHTSLPLDTLHRLLQQIESDHGRTRSEAKFSDRTLDIDILVYGQSQGNFHTLSLPRKDLLRYPFVLGPCCDLEPDYVHPATGRTLANHWQAMQKERFILERIPLVL